MQVSKAKYVRTHTERHHHNCIVYYKDGLGFPSNHGEGVALQKLS